MEYFPNASIFLLLKDYDQRFYSTTTLDFSWPLLLCTDVQTNMILLHYKMKNTFSLQKTNNSTLVCPTWLFLAGGVVLWMWVTFSICDLAAGRRSLESGCQGLRLPLLLVSVLFSPSQGGILWLPPRQWHHWTQMHCTFSLSCQNGGKFWNSGYNYSSQQINWFLFDCELI